MNSGRHTMESLLIAIFVACCLAGATAVASSNAEQLDSFKRHGDLVSQRRHLWTVLIDMTNASVAYGTAPFASWYGQDAVFHRGANDDAAPPLTRRGLSRMRMVADDAHTAGAPSLQSADAPILTYTLYNAAAYDHIRRHQLHLRTELDRLRRSGAADRSVAGNRSVSDFPADAIVIKTAWWPVARNLPTPLPVWDAGRNPPRSGGNDYLSWRRVVAVDPTKTRNSAGQVAVDFAGQSYPAARRVSLNDFYNLRVDEEMALEFRKDPAVNKAALLVLGRSLEAGDHLVLVGANLATKEINDWVWGTLWWHDQAGTGPFAADRPSVVRPPWTNYLVQVAFDAETPKTSDGAPHVCFNPWLEGRFPDGGQGGGTASNCLACHRRASYPAVAFLPVTRGAPNLHSDPAYAQDRLRTNFIWAIALHAKQ